jgi:hypothetical protein
MLHDWTDTDHFPWNTKKIHTHMFKMITHFLDNRHVEVLWSIDQKLVIQNTHTHTVRTCLQGGEILKWVELDIGT